MAELEVKIRVGFVNVFVEGGLYDLTIHNLSLSLRPHCRTLREKVLTKMDYYACLTEYDDQFFFVRLSEDGFLDLFDLESGEHLLTLDSKQVLYLVKEIENRFWKGDLVFKSEETGLLCSCSDSALMWRDLLPFCKKGLEIKPGDIVTQGLVLKAYKILQDCFAEDAGFEPKKLMDLCLQSLSMETHPEYKSKYFWSVPYVLMRHQGMRAISMKEVWFEGSEMLLNLF